MHSEGSGFALFGSKLNNFSDGVTISAIHTSDFNTQVRKQIQEKTLPDPSMIFSWDSC